MGCLAGMRKCLEQQLPTAGGVGEHSSPKAGNRRGGDGLMVWYKLFTAFSLMLSE